MACPCCSGLNYEQCCQIYHLGKLPEKALYLMRARYSAYAKGRSDFIIATTHPKHKDFQKELKSWVAGVETFSKNTEFQKLEIVSFEEGESVSFVTFKAYLKQNEKPFVLHERSRFEKIEGKWLYLTGEIFNS